MKISSQQIAKFNSEIYESQNVPNITIWSWVYKALNLYGIDAMIFCILFNLTACTSSYTAVSLTKIAEWLHMSRQTLSKKIDAIPYIDKCSVTNSNKGKCYTHNIYGINAKQLLDACIEYSKETAIEYEQDIKKYIVEQYPQFKDCINDIFKEMHEADYSCIDVLDNYSRANIKVNTNKSSDNYTTSNAYNILNLFNNSNYTELNNILKEAVSVNKSNSDSNILNNTTTDAKVISANCDNTTTKLKRPNVMKGPQLEQYINNNNKGKKASPDLTNTKKLKEVKKVTKQAETEQAYIDMAKLNENFVAMHCNNDSTIAEYLDIILNNRKNSKKYADKYDVKAWQLCLNKLIGCPIDVIKADLEICVIKTYSSFGYDAETYKGKQDNKKVAYNLIDEYAKSHSDVTPIIVDKLRIFFDIYIKHYNAESESIKSILSDLDKFPTEELKLEAVENSIKGGYRKFYVTREQEAIINKFKSSEVDINAKLKAIDDFIDREYLCLVPDIKTSLVEYVNSKVGKAMDIDTFNQELNKLVYYTGTDNEITQVVNVATNLQTTYLCKEDYNTTKEIKQEYNSLDDYAKARLRDRKGNCEVAYRQPISSNYKLLTPAIKAEFDKLKAKKST